KKIFDAFGKSGRSIAVRQVHPLHPQEGLGHIGGLLFRSIDNHRDYEPRALRHVVRAIGSKPPFAPEVAFRAALRLRRYDRNKERTVVNALSDLLVPHIPTTQLSLIKPDFNPRGAQRLADSMSRR